MERRVLGMPTGLSAGITTIRNTEPEVPRERRVVSKCFELQIFSHEFWKKRKPRAGRSPEWSERFFESEEKQKTPSATPCDARGKRAAVTGARESSGGRE
jgi:hypothetical protein